MRAGMLRTGTWGITLLAAAAVIGLAPPVMAGTGNYLIITAQEYADAPALAQFVNAKAAMGFTVSTYVVPSGTTKENIKAHIQSLWGGPDEPDYVLIIGDSTGTGAATTTTIPNWVGQGSRQATTDLPYACMDAGDDWYPDLFIGRFPATSDASLQIIVDKTLQCELGPYPDPDYVKRAAFLATSDSTAQAEQNHDWVIANYLDRAGFSSVKIYANQGGGTSNVTAAVNSGMLFTVYFGHSSSDGWWEPSFRQTHINGLSNAGLYGLACGWSCNTAHFDYSECSGETWVRAANKGAAAYLSASDYVWWGSVSSWESSRRMERYFFQSFFSDEIWEVGPAWQAALWRILNDPDFGPYHDHTRNIFEEFVLLGDPALLLPQGNGFTLDVTPAGHSLCVPPSTHAMYTIQVRPMGSFAENVTLSVTGLPLGVTASFDENSHVPPFTSVLTLHNLQYAPAGAHSPLITGTAASWERSTAVSLNIADGAPEAVTLLSPADGALGVALAPELTWQSVAAASAYDLEIATDAGFQNIIYTRTASAAAHTVETPLPMLAQLYWRVCASNQCGDGPFGQPFTFTTVNQIMPAYYDLQNGETGTYSYYDDQYDGNGNNQQPLAWLTDGLGDLTDGVRATAHWNSTSAPYVGWKSIQPTITFHFAEPVHIDVLTINVDDTGGGGGVVPPSDVTIVMGGETRVFEVADPAGSAPFDASFSGLGLTGTSLALTLQDDNFSTSRYMMLSEVFFFGGPASGACCVGTTCTVMTEADCKLAGGEYQGDGTGCDPNPCIVISEPQCLIISEIVDGTLSGDCPRFVEITNTGDHDYTFPAGGLIVQMDFSNDVDVDVDLTGVTIPAGYAYVINATQFGGCTGAFQAVYGFDPDLSVNDVTFGNGNDRYILTDTADGSNLLDIYGTFGVPSGTWSYEDGYSYRLAAFNHGTGGTFHANEWFYGGKDSLEGPDPEGLLRQFTTPGTHTFAYSCSAPAVCLGDSNCDGVVSWRDIDFFVAAMNDNQSAWEAVFAPSQPSCPFANNDVNEDGTVNWRDIDPLVAVMNTLCR